MLLKVFLRLRRIPLEFHTQSSLCTVRPQPARLRRDRHPRTRDGQLGFERVHRSDRVAHAFAGGAFVCGAGELAVGAGGARAAGLEC